MLFINFKILRPIINRGDSLKEKGQEFCKNFFFKNLRNHFLDNHMKDVMPKFRRCRLNDVATIEKIHTFKRKKTTEKAISREINIFSKN